MKRQELSCLVCIRTARDRTRPFLTGRSEETLPYLFFPCGRQADKRFKKYFMKLSTLIKTDALMDVIQLD